ncbi:histidine kinase dimerization/phospho-acceptor domain-containing protein [Chitinophaga sp. Ak27]|uniref:histidine kinase dimerization/phospho-acceptor domain-containing protein n=1 Tax=Chitinophaga sp. Ak27 TaxID=2726116 RepID=UPI00145E2C28|nr:histidine kinase dimerization/phospho-acceptor domain-containing protein [Chitinophaga sp. Ak27]NLU91389.1 hypothetical protein [Chitinophaga sp. Ak27]
MTLENNIRSTDEMLKDIFHGALHEIRTPINAITTAVRLLNDSPEENQEFRKELIQMITTPAENLSANADSVLGEGRVFSIQLPIR